MRHRTQSKLMAHLEVYVNGERTFDGHVDDVVLPSNPADYPTALRPQPGQAPTPLARITMLTALIELLRRTLESPLLQPIDVDVQTHGIGRFTLAAAMELPSG